MAEERLEVRVDVGLVILRVSEEVKASAVIHISVFELELDLISVLGAQHIRGQVDSVVLEPQLVRQRYLLIDSYARDLFSLEIQK